MEEDELTTIGFMFDSNHHKSLFSIQFEEPINEIKFKCIGDDPGHVQSGQYIWPAAKEAVNYLIKHWNNLQSSNIIELGSGCGLLGIAISRLSTVQRITLTDYDAGCLDLINENIILNSPHSCAFNVNMLKWGETCNNSYETYPLIIGSDLLYSEDIVNPLFFTLNQLMGNDSVFVLISSFDIGKVYYIYLVLIILS